MEVVRTGYLRETPPRDFAQVMRGYEPHRAGEYVCTRASEVRRHQEDATGARRDFQDAQRPIEEQERPTYSGLGARIEQLLRLAEEHATAPVPAARGHAH